MHTNLTKTVTRTTTSKFSAVITAEEIRKAFGLPEEAQIEFQVPGGGNWSNLRIDIDADNPIHVRWETTETEELR